MPTTGHNGVNSFRNSHSASIRFSKPTTRSSAYSDDAPCLLPLAIIANRLCDRQNMPLIELAVESRASVPGSAKNNTLPGVVRVWTQRVVGRYKLGTFTMMDGSAGFPAASLTFTHHLICISPRNNITSSTLVWDVTLTASWHDLTAAYDCRTDYRECREVLSYDELAGHPHQIGQRTCLHLLHDLPTMCFYRDLANSKFSANLFIQHAGNHQHHDLPFPARQQFVAIAKFANAGFAIQSHSAALQVFADGAPQDIVSKRFHQKLYGASLHGLHRCWNVCAVGYNDERHLRALSRDPPLQLDVVRIRQGVV